jgi:pilus assembly protein CpaD
MIIGKSLRSGIGQSILTGLGLGLAIASLSASPAPARDVNRGVEPARQPVVQRTEYVFDVRGDELGALSPGEQARLADWFEALDLRYGDRISIASGGASDLAGVRTGIKDLIGRHGLLLAANAPQTAGAPPAGMLRIVVSRASASVPGCPAWAGRSDADFSGGSSDGYGCAINSNLAAMIADPNDLVEGRSTQSDLRTALSNRAIKTYQEQAPTGAGGLKSEAAGGN